MLAQDMHNVYYLYVVAESCRPRLRVLTRHICQLFMHGLLQITIWHVSQQCKNSTPMVVADPSAVTEAEACGDMLYNYLLVPLPPQH